MRVRVRVRVSVSVSVSVRVRDRVSKRAQHPQLGGGGRGLAQLGEVAVELVAGAEQDARRRHRRRGHGALRELGVPAWGRYGEMQGRYGEIWGDAGEM